MDMPHIKTELPGPKAQQILQSDERFISPSYTRCYPMVAKSAKGMMVEDVDGNSYLDFAAGIAVCAAGHSHPKVVEAIKKQADKLIHMSGTDFYYTEQVALAEKLAEITPGSFPKKSFFGNSGAESIECGIKLARWYTKRVKMIAFIGAFHGRTMGALSLTASKAAQREGFAPFVPGVVHVPFAYCYRCPFGQTYGECNFECVHHIEYILEKVAPPSDVAAIFAEPIQGEGGYVVPPPEYFGKLKTLCEDNGILLVVDEVQSGFGRTGKMFAIEHWKVTPDIICMAKGIASGSSPRCGYHLPLASPGPRRPPRGPCGPSRDRRIRGGFLLLLLCSAARASCRGGTSRPPRPRRPRGRPSWSAASGTGRACCTRPSSTRTTGRRAR